MKIVRNNIIPLGRHFAAINLFGIFFVKNDVIVSDVLINHESIHTAQMRELLYLPFYVLYILEWMVRLVQLRGRFYEAYARISFEREAYAHDHDLTYLGQRKPFAQWRRLA